MILKIRTRMIISFSAIVLFTVALLSFSANIILENQFRDYVMKKQEQKNISMLQTVAGSYIPSQGEWKMDYLENICVTALESDMILKIKDADGQIIWDATHHDNERCEEILDKMSSNIHLFFPGT
ncbi:MAG: hypothetical protein HGA49_11745, partial [Eubacteriaceae bacterium]|nr:hypothetical protein [Eubacteriaceae bacterium]